MKEIFILFNKVSGIIDGGSGRVDRERDEKVRDGSTTLEYIERKLSENLNLEVQYLPLDTLLPDPTKHKIVGDKIIDIPKQEIEKKEQREKLILARIRKIAEDQLKAEGKIE